MGKGLVELMLFKRDVLKQLLDQMNELDLPSDVKSTLWSITTSVAAYRAKAGYSYNPHYKPVKKTFMAGWPRSSEMFFMLVDSLVFSYVMDDHLRLAMHNAQKADAFYRKCTGIGRDRSDRGGVGGRGKTQARRQQRG